MLHALYYCKRWHVILLTVHNLRINIPQYILALVIWTLRPSAGCFIVVILFCALCRGRLMEPCPCPFICFLRCLYLSLFVQSPIGIDLSTGYHYDGCYMAIWSWSHLLCGFESICDLQHYQKMPSSKYGLFKATIAIALFDHVLFSILLFVSYPDIFPLCMLHQCHWSTT